MANMRLFCLALAICLASAVSAQQPLPLLSNAFGDNMVLYAGPSAHLWGWTKEPTTSVLVQVFQGSEIVNSVTVTAQNGKWSASLNQEASFEPHTIVVATPNGAQTATLRNVLFGEVFICGGQSNMQMGVAGVFNASAEIVRAAKYPHIRLFTAGQKNHSTTPLDNFGSIVQPWTKASSETVGKNVWDYFSAVCWFSARDYYDQLPKEKKVPIGLMSINWGGTYIQTWLSPAVREKCEDPMPPRAAPNMPGLLYNAMLKPVLGMSVNGILWYQGESNVGHYASYACFFAEMIEDWAQHQSPKVQSPSRVPFYFVQLSPYTSGMTPSNHMALPGLREMQQITIDKVPSVTGITAIDTGDPGNTPNGNIHPRDKQTLGVRLAYAMLRAREGHFERQGPILEKVTHHEGSNLLLTFKSDSPLSLVPVKCPADVDPLFCSGWQILASDRKWYDASASLGGETHVILHASLPSGATAVAIRYAYNAWPLVSLYDRKGFPAWPINQKVQ